MTRVWTRQTILDAELDPKRIAELANRVINIIADDPPTVQSAVFVECIVHYLNCFGSEDGSEKAFRQNILGFMFDTIRGHANLD